MINEDIFEPYNRLVEIEISGRIREVPENNSLLRCFQFLSMETVSYGEFCWNGNCANCRIWLEDTLLEKPVLACRTKVRAGMKIIKLNDAIKLED